MVFESNVFLRAIFMCKYSQLLKHSTFLFSPFSPAILIPSLPQPFPWKFLSFWLNAFCWFTWTYLLVAHFTGTPFPQSPTVAQGGAQVSSTAERGLVSGEPWGAATLPGPWPPTGQQPYDSYWSGEILCSDSKGISNHYWLLLDEYLYNNLEGKFSREGVVSRA